MSRREKFLFGALILAVLIAGGWYYLKLQKTIAPAGTPVSNNSEISSTDIPELESHVVLDGLSNVWDIGFLPDGTAIFTEREGTISKIEDDRKVVLHTVSNIFARGEGGLMGLVVDPKFSENRFIYACYNTDQDIRVSRWKVSQGTAALTDQTDIITGAPVNTNTFPGRHSGCRLRFDANDILWIGTGDVAVGTNPQDTKSLGGKILRVNRDGQPVEGNLGVPFDPRIFSYGHRNTQGLALFDKPKDGSMGYSVEHGPGRDDEVNRLMQGNFGWNPVPGYNERVPMTDKQEYPDAIDAVWSSGDSTIAPSGAAIITGNKWKAYEGQLAVAVLKDEHVRLFDFDVSGKNVVSERRLFVGEYGRIRSVVMGPDDSLYLTTDNGDDQIIRIMPRR